MLTPKIGKVMAEFWERRGMPVYQAAGVYWTPFSHGSRFLMSVPEQVSVDHSHDELARILWRKNLVAARYPTMERRGVESGYYVWRKREFALASLDRKLRNTVRRAQEQCALRPLDAADLRKLGLPLNHDTMQRQERFNPEFGEESRWNRFVDSVFATPGMSVTGAFVGDELAAYSIECRADGWWYGMYQNSRTSLLKTFPNQALDFYSLERASQDAGVEGVLNSPLPLSPNPGLHDYKSKFGYEIAPYRLVIQLHPLLDRLPNSSVARQLLRRAHEAMPENRRVLQAARFWAGVTLPEPATESVPVVAPAGWQAALGRVRAEYASARERLRAACDTGLEASTARYVKAVVGAGALSLGAAAYHWTSTNTLLWATYLAWALLTCTMKIRFPGVNGAVGANFVFSLLAFAQLSWTEAVSIAALSTLFECYWRPLQQPTKLQAAFNVATLAVSAAAAHLVHRSVQVVAPDVPVLPLTAAAMTLFVCNTWLVAGVLGLLRQEAVSSVWRRCHLCSFPFYLFGSVAAALIVHAQLPQSWIAGFLVVPAMYLGHQFWSQVVQGMQTSVSSAASGS